MSNKNIGGFQEKMGLVVEFGQLSVGFVENK